MHSSLIVPALLGAALLAAPAFAAETATEMPSWDSTTPAARQQAAADPAARCAALRDQFRTTIAGHHTSPNTVDARIKSEDGGQLCESGLYREGMDKLQQAIDELAGAAKS